MRSCSLFFIFVWCVTLIGAESTQYKPKTRTYYLAAENVE